MNTKRGRVTETGTKVRQGRPRSHKCAPPRPAYNCELALALAPHCVAVVVCMAPVAPRTRSRLTIRKHRRPPTPPPIAVAAGTTVLLDPLQVACRGALLPKPIICRSEVIVAALKRSPWFNTAW